jgi:hypothetical protein
MLPPDDLVRYQDEPYPVNERTHLVKRATTRRCSPARLGALLATFSTRLVVIVVFRLDVAVEDFVLVDDAADASRLLGLSGELERDLKSRRVGRHQLRGRREMEGEADQIGQSRHDREDHLSITKIPHFG